MTEQLQQTNPSFKEDVDDLRPSRGGWAPGRYLRKCVGCGDGFIGDKRAVTCADCAYGFTKQ